MPNVEFDAINDALDRCSDLGFEMVPGFATHWPMGAETMIALGHPESVAEWADLYRIKHKHYPRPEETQTIDGADEASWRAALGDFDRAGDWQRFFERELDEQPWGHVLVQWWPRLIPGVAAGLTHGLIRTTHIVRALTRSPLQPTKLQLRELATGLAYWAARYVAQLPAVPLVGNERLPAILATIPRHPDDSDMPLRDKGFFLHIPGVQGWADAVRKLPPPRDLQTALSDLTTSFAQVNMAHPHEFPIPLIHTVTAPAALRLMLPHLPEELHLPSYIAIWQACAALLTTFAPQPNQAEVASDAPQQEQNTLSAEELSARAVEHGDEHAMKYTEACLREYAIRPDARYLLAAEKMLGRLPRYYRGSKPRP